MTNVSNNSNDQRVQQQKSKIIQNSIKISIKSSVQQVCKNVLHQCPTAVSFSLIDTSRVPSRQRDSTQ
jgi:hypothetical protein